MRGSLAAQSDLLGGYAANDRHGSDIGIHHGASSDHRTFADGHAVKDANASSDPDIILDCHALLGETLFRDGSAGVIENMIGGDDHAMRCDTHGVADPKPAVAVEDRKRVDGAVLSDRNLAAVGQDHRVGEDDRTGTDLDYAAPAAIDRGVLADLNSRAEFQEAFFC